MARRKAKTGRSPNTVQEVTIDCAWLPPLQTDKFEFGALCWNCRHAAGKEPVGVPNREKDGRWALFGTFCSYECALRHVLDDDSSFDRDQRVLWLHHVAGQERIRPAPDYRVLESFGGHLTIEAYRSFNGKPAEIAMFPRFPESHGALRAGKEGQGVVAGVAQAQERSLPKTDEREALFPVFLKSIKGKKRKEDPGQGLMTRFVRKKQRKA